MLGSLDDFVLELGGQVDKVGTVPRHPDQQIAVFLGVFLGRDEGILVDDIELEVSQFHIAGGPDQRHQIPGSHFPVNSCRTQLQIQ